MEPQHELLKGSYKLFSQYKKFADLFPKPLSAEENKENEPQAKEKDKEGIYHQIRILKVAVKEDEVIQRELKNEFNNFCRILLKHIREARNAEKEIDRLFVRKLIYYISLIGSNSVMNRRTIKYLLTAFIKTIEMASEGIKDEKAQKKAEEAILRTLDDLKLTKTLLELMCSKESNELDFILPLLLRLANKLLTGPIKEIQDQFYAEFARNPHSERLFERMHSIIDRSIFIYHHHFNCFGMDETQTNKLGYKIDVQAEILKFLRALCEDHNSDLQSYMSSQEYSKNNYNMVVVLSDYLSLLIKEIQRMLENSPTKENYEREMSIRKIRMSNCYDHAILCMQALTEFVQGPSIKNQEEISNTTFFATAETILEIKYVFDERLAQFRSQLIDNFGISQLKKECAILLLSLMEQRKSDDPLVAKMRLRVTEKYVLYNIYYVYFAFIKHTDGALREDLLFLVLIVFNLNRRIIVDQIL